MTALRGTRCLLSLLCVGWIAVAIAPEPARALSILVDFESPPVSGGGPDPLQYPWVTISAVGGGTLVTGTNPPGFNSLLEGTVPIRKELRADFAEQVTSVSVDLGDFGGDADGLFLEAFDANGALVAADSDLLAAGTGGMLTLSVSAAEIWAIQFGARAPSVDGSSVFADNLSFEVVPEPATALLLGSGLAALSLRSRVRRPA
jgi:hypothetical protein